MQLAIDFSPRETGRMAGEACTAKAEKVADFDTAGAQKFILSWLVRHGLTSGEDLTDAAMLHGFRPHDMRAFGPVFAGLSRKKLIRCAGYCERRRGHGTAGGRIWAAVL